MIPVLIAVSVAFWWRDAWLFAATCRGHVFVWSGSAALDADAAGNGDGRELDGLLME